MGRKEKCLYKRVSIEHKSIIDVREIGYYSTPAFVARYIGRRMWEINSKGKTLLDPCCGKEELTSYFNDLGVKTLGMDLIRYKEHYSCEFKKKDFISYYCTHKNTKEWEYDYYIANPPYNCHEVDFIKKNKEYLKGFFQEVGVHNMYSMFIYAIIDKAKEGAIIGLITHDSFFSAKNHKSLRKKIIDECSIEEITMCPRELFHNQGADVRTSIVILRKGKKYQKKVIVNNRAKSMCEFRELLKKNLEGEYSENLYGIDEIILSGKKDNLEFLIECPKDIRRIFNNIRLGECFKCVTGISTGNDKKYLSKNKEGVFNIPFYKNPGKDKFYTERVIYLHEDFLNIEKNVENFNVRNKKLLYKPGLTCSSIGIEFAACILPKGATFGVNPNIICETEDMWWLLAYLNSSLVTYMVRGALIRSNMITSGYVSRIPLLDFKDKEKEELRVLAQKAYKNRQSNLNITYELSCIDNIVNHAAKISNDSEEFVLSFKKNLVHAT